MNFSQQVEVLNNIIQEQSEVLQELKQLNAAIKNTRDGQPGDASDTATMVADINSAINRMILLTERAERLEHVITRLQSPNAGLCEDCGTEIPPERIAAIPWTCCCAPCQERRERRAQQYAPSAPAITGAMT